MPLYTLTHVCYVCAYHAPHTHTTVSCVTHRWLVRVV